MIPKVGRKSLIYVFLVGTVLVYTFIFAARQDMHKVMPGGLNRHINSLGIAVSNLRYGLSGVRGYNKVVQALISDGIKRYGETLKAGTVNPAQAKKDLIYPREVIEAAANIKDVSTGGIYYLLRQDKGWVEYCKIAFKLFGYKMESLFYLYFLLLTISTLIFAVTFIRRRALLNVLLLFMCSHFVVVACAPVAGVQLLTVHNVRFLPVLAVLPAFYLALLILGKHAFTKTVLVYAFIQAAIVMFIIYIRGSVMYQILFLVAVAGLAALRFSLKNRRAAGCVFNKVYLWPLAAVLVLFIIFKAQLMLRLNYPYTITTSRQAPYHTVYLGLAAHPDSKPKYGIEYRDSVAVNLVRRRVQEQYGAHLTVNEDLYEKVLKDEFFKIVKADPWFVIGSYLYKVPLFFKEYFVSFGAIKFLFRWEILLALLVGTALAGEVFLKQWLHYFSWLVLAFLFSLIPSFLAVPAPYLIADPGLSVTLLIYMLVAGGASWLFARTGAFKKLREE